MEYNEKIRLLKRHKIPPICRRCGQPIRDVNFHYVKTRTRGELWYHENCFYLEVLSGVDSGKREKPVS